MKTICSTLTALCFCLLLNPASSAWAQCSDCQGSPGGWGWNAERRAQRQEQWADAHEKCDRIYQRNKAWPKPFECWDRTSYLNIWNTMYYSGLATHCTLTDAHFDPVTGKLNQLGERKVVTIMQNNPELQRGLLVANSRDPQITELRLSQLRTAVGQWYGEDVAAQIVTTNVIPRAASGSRVEAINIGYSGSMQAPALSGGSSSGSSSGSSGSGSSN